MVNQVLIAGILQGLSEGLVLAKANGLDVAMLTETLKGGAAQSWQLENRAVTMGKQQFDFGFAIDWMIKDLGIALDQAQESGLNLPLAQQVKSAYESLSAKGLGRSDTSVLIQSLDAKP